MPEKREHLIEVPLSEDEMDFLGIKNLPEKEQGEKLRRGLLTILGWKSSETGEAEDEQA